MSSRIKSTKEYFTKETEIIKKKLREILKLKNSINEIKNV